MSCLTIPLLCSACYIETSSLLHDRSVPVPDRILPLVDFFESSSMFSDFCQQNSSSDSAHEAENTAPPSGTDAHFGHSSAVFVYSHGESRNENLFVAPDYRRDMNELAVYS